MSPSLTFVYQENGTPTDICRRTVTTVITQPYSYMIYGGLHMATCVPVKYSYFFTYREMILPPYE